MYPEVHYNNRYFLFAACFISAAFIVLFDQEVTFFQAWTYPSFYPALGGSMIISGILIGFIHWMTTRLDKRYPWDMIVRRSTYQFFLGLAIPGALAFVLAAIYFRIFSHSILEPDCEYLKVDYPVIILLMLMLNMYYLIHYFIIYIAQLSPKGTVIVPDDDANNDIGQDSPPFSETPTEGKILTSPLYIFQKGKHRYICSEVGYISIIKGSLTSIEALLPAQQYFRINRQFIIRYDIFKGFKTGSKKGTLQLFGLRDECFHELMGFTAECFTVTEDRAKLFKAWYNLVCKNKP